MCFKQNATILNSKIRFYASLVSPSRTFLLSWSYSFISNTLTILSLSVAIPLSITMGTCPVGDEQITLCSFATLYNKNNAHISHTGSSHHLNIASFHVIIEAGCVHYHKTTWRDHKHI